MVEGLEMYTSSYTASAGDYIVTVDINAYNAGTDFLLVFLNNEYVSEDDYSLNTSEKKVIFTEPLEAGDLVEFLVFITSGVDIDVSEFGYPQSRNEAIILNLLGGTNSLLYPESRMEALLLALLKNSSIDASGNANVMACLNNIQTAWAGYSTGMTFVSPVAAGGPVAGVIVYKYTDDYGAVLIMSYHPMFPHPAYCRMFAGEWTTPYWI